MSLFLCNTVADPVPATNKGVVYSTATGHHALAGGMVRGVSGVCRSARGHSSMKLMSCSMASD